MSSTSSSAVPATSSGERKVRVAWYRRYINLIGPVIMILMLALTMAIAEPRFFEFPNLMIILQDAAIYMVLGMAMTLVITAKGIDLSIGAVAALPGVASLLIGTVLYHRTKLGRYAIAIGANREAAVLTGIDINRQKLYLYALMGVCAAIAGVLLTGRLNAIQATTAMGFALHTIAAVVVGGTARSLSCARFVH